VARWFVLSDSPPERDVEWTESGVVGAWRFSKKVWALVANVEAGDPLVIASDAEGPALDLRRFAHKAMEKITAGIEAFRFNTSVAQIYELTNALGKYKANDDAKMEALGLLIRAIAPLLVYHAPWPKVDPDMLIEDTITLPVQVNGKRRSEIKVPADMAKDDIQALAMADEQVSRSIDGLTVRKVIIVPGRIVNIVAN